MNPNDDATILCAGLSPAWQQVMVFRSFRYGEVNRASEVHWLAQGKAINAGIAAHHLGGPSLTLAPLGGPPLASDRPRVGRVGRCRGAGSSRNRPPAQCTTILDQATGTMTELIEECRPLAPTELDEFRRVYAEEAANAAVVVHDRLVADRARRRRSIGNWSSERLARRCSIFAARGSWPRWT